MNEERSETTGRGRSKSHSGQTQFFNRRLDLVRCLLLLSQNRLEFVDEEPLCVSWGSPQNFDLPLYTMHSGYLAVPQVQEPRRHRLPVVSAGLICD